MKILSGNLQRHHHNDAGSDLMSEIDVTIKPGQSEIIPTGVKVQLPPNTFGLVKSRSGLAFKFSIEATNAGVIDEAYNGEIKTKLYNHGKEPYKVNKGDRIAQLIVIPVIYPDIETISNDHRGDKGFGSSGK